MYSRCGKKETIPEFARHGQSQNFRIDDCIVFGIVLAYLGKHDHSRLLAFRLAVHHSRFVDHLALSTLKGNRSRKYIVTGKVNKNRSHNCSPRKKVVIGSRCDQWSLGGSDAIVIFRALLFLDTIIGDCRTYFTKFLLTQHIQVSNKRHLHIRIKFPFSIYRSCCVQ